jgi:hypothetical protein
MNEICSWFIFSFMKISAASVVVKNGKVFDSHALLLISGIIVLIMEILN